MGELSQYAVSEKCGLWYSKIYYSSYYGTVLTLITAGYKKKKDAGKIDLVIIMVMSVLGIVYLGITIFKSIETLAAYYFLMPLYGAATWMQIVRNGIAAGITNEK